MSEFVQITDSIISSVMEAVKFHSSYISIGLMNNHFLIACEDIHSMLYALPVEKTDHPDFVVSVEKGILKEIIQKGYLQVTLSEDAKTMTFNNYTHENIEVPWLQATVGYSYGPAVKNLASRLLGTTNEPIVCPQKIFSAQILNMMEMTKSSLHVKGGLAYSLGKDFSFYYTVDGISNDDSISFDYEAVRYISSSIKQNTKFYVSGNTYIMQTGNKYYTWRGAYTEVTDVYAFINKKPKCSYNVGVNPNVPYSFTKVTEKTPMVVTLDFSKSLLLIDSDILRIRAKFNQIKEDGTKNLLRLVIPQKYLKYIAGVTIKNIRVFNKFVRIISEDNIFIDIGCDVYFQE